ncbi:MAG: DUF4199 domain-containing protein [Flavobacteriales bacterium]
MNRIYLFPIGFALLWILIKQMAFLMGMFTFGSVQVFVLINMFLHTLTISLSLFFLKRNEVNLANFLQDMKKGIGTGMIYTLIVSGFIYLFYSKIHPEYNQYQVDQAKVLLENPKNIDKIRAKNPDLANKSDKEITKMSLQQAKMIASASFTFIISLLGMTLYTLFNSILIAIIYRRLLFRNNE